jgi:hypothetical protein
VSFFKKIFGVPDKPEGMTQVYEVSKDVIRRYMGGIVRTPSYAMLKSQHRNIPDIHLAVLMYSASDTARAMHDAAENQAMDLALKSCVAYDQGRLLVTESSWSYHLYARTDK